MHHSTIASLVASVLLVMMMLFVASFSLFTLHRTREANRVRGKLLISARHRGSIAFYHPDYA